MAPRSSYICIITTFNFNSLALTEVHRVINIDWGFLHLKAAIGKLEGNVYNLALTMNSELVTGYLLLVFVFCFWVSFV